MRIFHNLPEPRRAPLLFCWPKKANIEEKYWIFFGWKGTQILAYTDDLANGRWGTGEGVENWQLKREKATQNDRMKASMCARLRFNSIFKWAQSKVCDSSNVLLSGWVVMCAYEYHIIKVDISVIARRTFDIIIEHSRRKQRRMKIEIDMYWVLKSWNVWWIKLNDVKFDLD